LVPSVQRHHYTFVPALTVLDPQFRRALDGFGSVMAGGNAAVLLENGDGVFPAMIGDIREAKVSVDIEVYIFKPDEAGRRFADAMIEAARRGVEVYFLPVRQIREALVAAARRGVDVKVMVPGARIDVPMVRMASRNHYGPLLKGGVKIYEYQPTMLHTKAMVVDGIFSTIGSINFDERSMSKNAETVWPFRLSSDRQSASAREGVGGNG